MALQEINRVVDLVLGFYEEQKPLFDTLISNYLDDAQVTLFKGIRKNIPVSDFPSIEVGPVSDDIKWHAVRVQEESLALDIRVSIHLWDQNLAIDLEGKMVSLAARILTYPPHLRPQIPGTNVWLFDSELPSIQYGSTAANGSIRVSKISWSGKALDFLVDSQFPPFLQGGGDWVQ